MKAILIFIAALFVGSTVYAGGKPICSKKQEQRGCREAKKNCRWETQHNICHDVCEEVNGSVYCYPDPTCREWEEVWTCDYYCKCRGKRRRNLSNDDFQQLLEQWEQEDLGSYQDEAV